MSTVKVESIYKKFSSKLSDSVRSGIKEIVQSQKNSDNNSLLSSEFWALQDISFELQSGDSLGILGANGSGKTTLLRILNGTYKPTRGNFKIKEPIGSLIAAGAGFSPTLTGRENVFLSASLLGMSRKEITYKYDSIVEFSELGDFLEMPLSHYSSGMSVRLAFAVATSVTPEVLLIDEVLAVGDIGFQKKCFARIRELKKAGTTFLIVSHSTDTTWELCNKAIFLDSGKSNGVEDVKSAIAKYMNSSLSRKSSALQSEDPSQGEGGVKLSQISVQGSESSKDQIKFRDNLRIRANFETEKRIEGGYIRINISNEKYRPIATSDSSLFEGGIRDLEIGEHAMEIILNDVTLKPDRYYLDFSVCTKLGGPHLGLFKEAIHFDIQASPENHIYDFTLNALIDFPVEVLKFR